MNIVDTRFVDVDFSDVPVDPESGELMGRGLIEQTNAELMAALPSVPYFEDAYPELMVPVSRRRELAERQYQKQRITTRKIKNQGNFGSCVGFAAAQALETFLFRKYGIAYWVWLSGMSVYRRIGNSPGSGAIIIDGITAVTDGALPAPVPENSKWAFKHTMHEREWNQMPLGWLDTGRMFHVTKWAKARGRDEIESALLNDKTGLVGRNSHSICYPTLCYDDGFYVPYPNSWQESWGDNGWGFDSQRTYSNLVMYFIIDVAVRSDIVIPDLA
jgi:hypothetical protein